ncbi:MAG TPA: class I SAM-dependent methyltransferase [Acidimicrobiales bacterium]|nr:class I SAM-dependent methyltransferase [Acidimicrobiales bacterium]
MISEPDAGISAETKAARSSSFGHVAGHYERYRPGPPAEAVTWLIPTAVDTVVDLGAGTGALTRLLVGHAGTVIAVEPDERMRAVLMAEVAGITAVEGKGESMPLPDRSADAVIASSSWHWVDVVPALGEVARVLKPGGLLAALWSGPDPESPFIMQARELLSGAGGAGTSETLAALAERDRPVDQVLRIPEGLPFRQPELEIFRWDMALTADDLVGLLGTFSWVILMEPAEREHLLDTARRLLRDVVGIEGDTTIDIAFRCDTYRARLLD